MANVRKRRHSELFLFLLLGIIIGGLTGIVSMNALISSSMDEYHKKINELNNMVEEKDIQLEKLNETIHNSKIIIKSIEVKFQSKEILEDEIFKHQVEKVIKEKLKIVIGKDLEKIDMELLSSIIDKRIINLENKDYMIYLRKMLVGEKIKIWVEIKEIK